MVEIVVGSVADIETDTIGVDLAEPVVGLVIVVVMMVMMVKVKVDLDLGNVKVMVMVMGDGR